MKNRNGSLCLCVWFIVVVFVRIGVGCEFIISGIGGLVGV